MVYASKELALPLTYTKISIRSEKFTSLDSDVHADRREVEDCDEAG